jgi:hypothetical protein
MPATIRVENGISAGANYWIDRSVLRIGSDPQCDVCLPSTEVAPHALTLEYRDGKYRAYNRGASPMTVGTVAVPPGASETWLPDQAVQLGGQMRLVLETNGDPRPCPRPDAWSDNGDGMEPAALTSPDAPAEAPDAIAKQSSSTMIQLAVIGVCVLAIAAFLTMGGGEDTASPDRPTFEAIVEETLPGDGPLRSLLPRLQYAQAALVRGNDQLARQRFLKLRDQLVLARQSLPTDQEDGARRMLEYVEYRLSQLQ